MLALTSCKDVGVRRKIDNTVLSERDRFMNTYVDKLAKQSTDRDCVTEEQRQAIISSACRLNAVAAWLGVRTVTANACPRPPGDEATDKLRVCELAVFTPSGDARRRSSVRLSGGSVLPRRPSSAGLIAAVAGQDGRLKDDQRCPLRRNAILPGYECNVLARQIP